MSESYRGYTLNVTGDANWGNPENALLKKILDKIPQYSYTLVGSEHVHSSLVIPGGTGGGGTMVATTPVGRLEVTADIIDLTGANPTVNLVDTGAPFATGSLAQSGMTTTLSCDALTATVQLNPLGATVAGVLFQNDGTSQGLQDVANSGGQTRLTAQGTTLTVDGDNDFLDATFASGAAFRFNGTTGIMSFTSSTIDVGASLVYAGGYSLGGSGSAALISGSGNPSVMMPFPTGTIYIKTDSTSATDRLWVKTNGGAWAYLTTSA